MNEIFFYNTNENEVGEPKHASFRSRPEHPWQIQKESRFEYWVLRNEIERYQTIIFHVFLLILILNVWSIFETIITIFYGLAGF